MKLKFKLASLICVFAIPVILSSCKESIDVEEIASPNLSQGVVPSNKEIEEFKSWYSNLESNANARIGAKDEIDEVQEIELWKRAKIHQQDKSSNKLMTLPLVDFKEKGKTKVKQLYLTEINGKKDGYKVEINSSNGKSDKFSGTITIMSLDEKNKREYKYKDNKLESKNNARLADFDNVELPEVTVTASVQRNGTWYLVSVLFSPVNTAPVILYATVEPCGDWGCGFIDLEHDPTLIYELILAISQKLAELGKNLNQAERDILNTMSLSDIKKFYDHYLTATKLTDRMWPNTLGSWDATGHPNAFKHTIFAALHAKDFGFSVALQLTNAHEFGQGSGCDTQMDLLNNGIGITLGVSHSGTSNDLIMTIYNMAKNGQLWTVGGNCVHQVPF